MGQHETQNLHPLQLEWDQFLSHRLGQGMAGKIQWSFPPKQLAGALSFCQGNISRSLGAQRDFSIWYSELEVRVVQMWNEVCGHPTPSITPWQPDILYIWSISLSVFVTINKHTQAPRTSKRDQCSVYPPARLMHIMGQKNIREERLLDASQNDKTWRFRHCRVKRGSCSGFPFTWRQVSQDPWPRTGGRATGKRVSGCFQAHTQPRFRLPVDRRAREGECCFQDGETEHLQELLGQVHKLPFTSLRSGLHP